MRATAVALAIVLFTSAKVSGLSPVEMAEVVNTKGMSGLAEIWRLLVLNGEPYCDSESPSARLDWGDSEPGSAQVVVLVVSGECRKDVLLLGKTSTTWRCLGHEATDDRSWQPVEVLDSWTAGLLCSVTHHGSGTGCSSDSEDWFLLLPERSVKVCRFTSRSSELIHEPGAGNSDEDFEVSYKQRVGESGTLTFDFALKWSLAFEDKDGGCRNEDVLEVASRASVTVNKLTGEVDFESAELGNTWAEEKRLEQGDPNLVCSLARKRVLELAEGAPASCGPFLRRCAESTKDLCLAAELRDLLRARGLAEPAPEQDFSDNSTGASETK